LILFFIPLFFRGGKSRGGIGWKKQTLWKKVKPRDCCSIINRDKSLPKEQVVLLEWGSDLIAPLTEVSWLYRGRLAGGLIAKIKKEQKWIIY
jgi:hypothetical protein